MTEIQDRIETEFNNSEEVSYWQKRNDEDTEDCNVYHRFRTHPEVKKWQCRNKQEFKDHHKWYGYDHKYLDYETFKHEDSADFDHHATHHRVYCIACRKSKFLFETQKKADHFIKFNHDTIVQEHGFAPVRSYFCPLCGGWHVTHVMDKTLWRRGWTLSEFVDLKKEQLHLEQPHAEQSKSYRQQPEQLQVEQPLTEEQLKEKHLQEYLEKTRQRFEEEKRLFHAAFSVYDLKTCQKIQENFRQLVTEDEMLRGNVDDIVQQLDEMRNHIRSLRMKIIAAREDERRFIGDLQTGFRQKFHVFRQAYFCGDLETCAAFYNAVTQALADCQYKGKFLTKLRERENAMKREIEELKRKESNT